MTKEQRKEYMRKLGSAGGKATLKKHGSKHFVKLGHKGQQALWKSLKS